MRVLRAIFCIALVSTLTGCGAGAIAAYALFGATTATAIATCASGESDIARVEGCD